MIKHIRKWLFWRKRCLDSPLVKIAVLFGMKVPSFEAIVDREDIDGLN